ncbi:helix-turn-helix domain-containing protein [Carnobacterium pleistocenium]|uniref:helix-turn-helix domain-containing protein n=1 Tax=Carnobacterium pleistocenium TaxID=181073 RepID=UPI0022B51650|nr:helix-turn-helix transcriptional regulator [Carnobacterium pleistocenium]
MNEEETLIEIWERIKQKRKEFGMTQEELAKKTNVAHSTVSDWEIGSQYPDIQTIVLLSDELNISLDELLKNDKFLVKKITKDTNVRKKNKKTIIILSILIILISLVAVWISTGQPGRVETISNYNQIKSASLENNDEGYTLELKVNYLPAYRTLSLYSLDRTEGGKEVNLMLRTDLNLLRANSEELKVRWDNSFAEKAETLNIVDDKGKPIYIIKIP